MLKQKCAVLVLLGFLTYKTVALPRFEFAKSYFEKEKEQGQTIVSVKVPAINRMNHNNERVGCAGVYFKPKSNFSFVFPVNCVLSISFCQ